MIPSPERDRLRSMKPDPQSEAGALLRLDRWVKALPAGRLSKVSTMRVKRSKSQAALLLERAAALRGRSGITAPPTLHLGGLDWLDLTLYGDVKQRFKDTCARAQRARAELQSSREDKGLFYIGKHMGVLHATGRGHGFSHQPFHWKCRGISFLLGSCECSGDSLKRPLMFVDIPGESFLVLGEAGAFGLVQDVIETLGVDVKRLRVRRVDGCVDLAGVKVDEFYDVIRAKQAITRGSGISDHFDRKGELTGITVHGEACRLTIYDKLKRVKEENPQQLPYLVEHRWHGQTPPHATRVEFRIRPGELEFADVRDLGDLLECLQRIFHWATNVWFRLAEVKDRRHTERAKTHYLWLEVMAGFLGWTEGCDTFTTRRTPQPVPPRQLVAASIGMLAKAMALGGLEVEGKALEMLIGECMKEPSHDDISHAWEVMRNQFESRVWQHKAELPGG